MNDKFVQPAESVKLVSRGLTEAQRQWARQEVALGVSPRKVAEKIAAQQIAEELGLEQRHE